MLLDIISVLTHQNLMEFSSFTVYGNGTHLLYFEHPCQGDSSQGHNFVFPWPFISNLAW